VKLGFKFWVYVILMASSITSFLLTIYTHQVNQYELSIKLMILGATAFSILLLHVWISRGQ